MSNYGWGSCNLHLPLVANNHAPNPHDMGNCSKACAVASRGNACATALAMQIAPMGRLPTRVHTHMRHPHVTYVGGGGTSAENTTLQCTATRTTMLIVGHGHCRLCGYCGGCYKLTYLLPHRETDLSASCKGVGRGVATQRGW